MKKIYLLVLLAVSMSFALTIEGSNFSYAKCSFSSYCDYSPYIRLSNKGGAEIRGFRMYVYFANYGRDAMPRINRGDRGFTYWLEKRSAYVYRIVLDFGKTTTIPANGKFPEDGVFPGDAPSYNHMFFSLDMDIRWFDSHDKSEQYGWYPFPTGESFDNIVVESLDGKILYGKHPEVLRIGVLKKNSGDKCNEEVSIRLDTEDSSNRNDIDGDSNPPGIKVDKHGVKFTYCVLYRNELPRAPFDYAVLQLDQRCPDTSNHVVRRHDTEDSDNNNGSSGFIWPNEVGSNASLRYCFVQAGKNAPKKYPFDSKYGIFAVAEGFKNLTRSEIYVDDEDSNNNNKWNYYGAEDAVKKRINKIMSGSDNTTYHVVKWNGGSLAKSTEVADNSVSSAYVAAVPLAPAIKGLNRSIVSVELKSAGDVKVSVVGINGAVLANVTEKSLQPGDLQIKWNSGMVPSGRYIVKIEQNGMVNAKNVILK